MMDITKHTDLKCMYETEDNGYSATLIVNKKDYDSIRAHHGIFKILKKEYELSSFDTQYIGEGVEKFDMTIRLKLYYTDKQIRENKIKELLKYGN